MVAPERAFRFQTGETAASLPELVAVLRHAPPDTVWFHREHFAAWLREVVRDEALARRFEFYARHPPQPEMLRDILADVVATRVSGR